MPINALRAARENHQATARDPCSAPAASAGAPHH